MSVASLIVSNETNFKANKYGRIKMSKKPILKLNGFLPYRLSVISNRISSAIAARYQESFSITLPEWRIMAILGETPDLSAAQVSEKTAMDKVAVSRAVSRLLEAGYVERYFSKDDKRRSVLTLSADGSAIYGQVVPMASAYERDLLKSLTEAEQLQLHELLDKLETASKA